ncbi:hypothetical protein WA158_005328 [Blastocystis sp. Blastoise]
MDNFLDVSQDGIPVDGEPSIFQTYTFFFFCYKKNERRIGNMKNLGKDIPEYLRSHYSILYARMPRCSVSCCTILVIASYDVLNTIYEDVVYKRNSEFESIVTVRGEYPTLISTMMNDYLKLKQNLDTNPDLYTPLFLRYVNPELICKHPLNKKEIENTYSMYVEFGSQEHDFFSIGYIYCFLPSTTSIPPMDFVFSKTICTFKNNITDSSSSKKDAISNKIFYIYNSTTTDSSSSSTTTNIPLLLTDRKDRYIYENKRVCNPYNGIDIDMLTYLASIHSSSPYEEDQTSNNYKLWLFDKHMHDPDSVSIKYSPEMQIYMNNEQSPNRDIGVLHRDIWPINYLKSFDSDWSSNFFFNGINSTTSNPIISYTNNLINSTTNNLINSTNNNPINSTNNNPINSTNNNPINSTNNNPINSTNNNPINSTNNNPIISNISNLINSTNNNPINSITNNPINSTSNNTASSSESIQESLSLNNKKEKEVYHIYTVIIESNSPKDIDSMNSTNNTYNINSTNDNRNQLLNNNNNENTNNNNENNHNNENNKTPSSSDDDDDDYMPIEDNQKEHDDDNNIDIDITIPTKNSIRRRRSIDDDEEIMENNSIYDGNYYHNSGEEEEEYQFSDSSFSSKSSYSMSSDNSDINSDINSEDEESYNTSDNNTSDSSNSSNDDDYYFPGHHFSHFSVSSHLNSKQSNGQKLGSSYNYKISKIINNKEKENEDQYENENKYIDTYKYIEHTTSECIHYYESIQYPHELINYIYKNCITVMKSVVFPMLSLEDKKSLNLYSAPINNIEKQIYSSPATLFTRFSSIISILNNIYQYEKEHSIDSLLTSKKSFFGIYSLQISRHYSLLIKSQKLDFIEDYSNELYSLYHQIYTTYNEYIAFKQQCISVLYSVSSFLPILSTIYIPFSVSISNNNNMYIDNQSVNNDSSSVSISKPINNSMDIEQNKDIIENNDIKELSNKNDDNFFVDQLDSIPITELPEGVTIPDFCNYLLDEYSYFFTSNQCDIFSVFITIIQAIQTVGSIQMATYKTLSDSIQSYINKYNTLKSTYKLLLKEQQSYNNLYRLQIHIQQDIQKYIYIKDQIKNNINVHIPDLSSLPIVNKEYNTFKDAYVCYYNNKIEETKSYILLLHDNRKAIKNILLHYYEQDITTKNIIKEQMNKETDINKMKKDEILSTIDSLMKQKEYLIQELKQLENE